MSSVPFAAPSRPISWLRPDQQLPRDQYAPAVHHVAAWRSWSDARKLKALRELSEQYGRDPQFRQWVITTVLAGVADRDYRVQAATMLRWVQENIRYVNESNELLQSPAATLRVKNGDCDDMAILLGAMAYAVALPFRFVLAGRRGNGQPVRWMEGTPKPWGVQFHHIYVALGWPPFKPQEWQSAEPTIKGAPLGYDVVVHGLQRGPNGQPKLPEMAGWGSVGAVASEAITVLKEELTWKKILVALAQAVIVGVILRTIRKHWKRRK